MARFQFAMVLGFGILASSVAFAERPEDQRYPNPINVAIPGISTDKTVRYDYDIVYVRARRAGDKEHKRFYTDFSQPVTMEPGADLMLLHPSGSEELLVEGGNGSITDPIVSLDGQWVYYTQLYDLRNRSQWNPPRGGADLFKIHVKSRKIVRLTNQKFTPNTGAANWSSDFRSAEKDKTYFDYGVFNMGACPLPGGRIAFTSNRDGFKPSNGYPRIALQMFVMDDRDESIGEDDDPPNLEKIGHLNISGALHPVVLKDGRIMFSSLESQGIRGQILWGIWTIHPDGTNWAPLVSAFDPGGAPNGFHFQTQLSDGSLVIEEYYNQNNSGFGAYIKMPPTPPDGYAGFGPAYMQDERNVPWRYGRFDNTKPKLYRMPFMPTGSVSLTPFAHGREGPADTAIVGDKDSPRVGKFTHPSGAPDNHLLTIYSHGPVNHQYTFLPQLDGGIYLIKSGSVVQQPSEMLLIKNDPNYNESWPRAVVPYKRIYGIEEPNKLDSLANDGRQSKHLPAGTPFGLIGTSSLYKRESYPNGVVPAGKVTATYAGGNDLWKGLDAFTSHGNGMPLNWHNQGGDAGLYANDEIHAIRILAMEPTTDRQRGANSGRRFYSHASERLRILGEIPVRKFAAGNAADQPLDPDGNPDTSFLAKIPADTAFTFQTIDKDGLLLNMSQTWHHLRPGEIRHDCGGCHAHSQKPTDFALTAAAKPDYQVWDLVDATPLVTDKKRDKSGRQWDADNRSGLQTLEQEIVNVEYHRDIRPILERSCVACHSTRDERQPAGNLDLDADAEMIDIPHTAKVPGTFYRLAVDERARFGHKPVGYDSWGYPNASRYLRKFQARRSLLVWKIYGRRLDGFTNDDHPSESKPGARDLVWRGEPADLQKYRARWDLDYAGSPMPPPKAIAAGKVKPLSDADRRTITRWIDLGCPIDLDYDPAQPDRRGYGWMLDDNRPVLSLQIRGKGTEGQRGKGKLERIVVGMHDYYSGLDLDSFSVVADFEIDGTPPGENLAGRFQPLAESVWQLKLAKPMPRPDGGVLRVSIRDRQGNTTEVAKTFNGDATTVARAAPNSARPGPRNQANTVAQLGLPPKVHVFEDYETEIERRWWLRGEPVTDQVPKPLVAGERNTRACRATETKDFDRKMGDPSKTYKAVIFNPVPGPPMGANTRLSFRYRLSGTDTLRVQIYSLTNNYHRHLVLTDLPQERWQSATVDMTQARRPDGSGGPLCEDERIDDIQFYIDPSADLWIDDIVLYEVASEKEKRPFPGRVIFTGWFDTGKQGKEWPGDFEIVAHQSPRTWDAAKSVTNPRTGHPWLRVHLRGPRRLGAATKLRFRYHLTGADKMRIELANSKTSSKWSHDATGLQKNEWAEAEVVFASQKLGSNQRDVVVDNLRFILPPETTLFIDDVLLYVATGK